MKKGDLEKMDQDKKKTICWKCSKKIDREDQFCKYCGAKQSKKVKNNGIAGLIFQFLVIGPFCLISLWKSKNISIDKKKKYTFWILIATIILLIGIFYALSIIINYYNQILGI